MLDRYRFLALRFNDGWTFNLAAAKIFWDWTLERVGLLT
jgi:hypothetical protein